MYINYVELNKYESIGKDYQIKVSRKSDSEIAIIAPHGGLIESETSGIAEAIAGDDFNLYLFEGKKADNNYETLHLTSHLFDEPQCLELISKTKTVISIHGCNGKNKTIFIGGLDIKTKNKLANNFNKTNICVHTENHKYPGKNPNNICNRGLTKQGVQIELTDPLRKTNMKTVVINTIRNTLLTL